jgi:hypothetical protein
MLAQSTDRAVRNVEGPGDVRQNFACLSARNGFPTLMRRQLRPATHDDTTSHSTLPSLPGSGPDQFALEFSQTAQHS